MREVLVRGWITTVSLVDMKALALKFGVFTCGFSPGLRTGSVKWIKFWLFTFSKSYKSNGNQYKELSISNKKCGKHNLEYLLFLEIWKNDKSCGNQYLENIRLTELGTLNKERGKHNFEYLRYHEIWKNDKSWGNQSLYFFVWQSWVYQTKCVEYITCNICVTLKSEKMSSFVETNT